MTFITFLESPFKVVKENKDLLMYLIKRNIASRYRGTMLGTFWTIVQPLLLLLVYSFVFSVVFKSRWAMASTGSEVGDKYAFAIIMFCGMTVFNIFGDSITSSPTLIVNNQNYVKKIVFPIAILPIAQVMTAVFINLIWLFILFLGSVFFLNSLSWTMLFLPIIFIPYIMLSMGLSFFLASMGVYFRDISQICLLVVQVLYMMTPIFYSLEMVPQKFKQILMLNPLTLIVEETRAVFLFKQIPDIKICSIIFLLSMIIFYFGYYWLERTKEGFSDAL